MSEAAEEVMEREQEQRDHRLAHNNGNCFSDCLICFQEEILREN